MSKLSEYEALSLEKLGQAIQGGRWSNEGLVQLIELAGGYLNAKSISAYAKEQGISYNGAKHHLQVVIMLGNKYVIDNN